jgi:hypothetical protein
MHTTSRKIFMNCRVQILGIQNDYTFMPRKHEDGYYDTVSYVV